MLQRRWVLEPDVDYPLYITAKQYWHPELVANWDDPGALALIFLHSTSFHKETWEPTLQHLLEGCQNYPKRPFRPKIKCAWVIECPNHGESAVLNDLALQRPALRHSFGCEKYAEAVHRFMLRGPTLPTPVDFRREQLVGIGHSLGGVSISILPTLEPTFDFRALILVEPMFSPEGMDKLRDLRARLIINARERCNVWSSRQSALQYFRQNTKWDASVIHGYVQYGMRTRGSIGRELDDGAVTLACSRGEEEAMYQDMTGPPRGIASLNKLSATTPVGVIFGDKNNHMPREVQNALVDPTSGRHIREVSRIKGVGHLIPQQAPAELSRVLLDVLCRLVTSLDTSSKL